MTSTTEPVIRSPWSKWLVGLSRLGLCLVAYFLILEIVRMTVGPNWHVIVPQELYRSAQLSESELQTAVDRFGIKTIINLRSKCPWESWYRDEACVSEQRNVKLINLNFSAYLPPPPQELQKLWKALETAPRPILIHCRRGADRTGLASSLAMLHHDDKQPLATSIQQLSIRAGHLGLGRVEIMGIVLDMYKQWLGTNQLEHDRSNLKKWIHEGYRPCTLWAKIDAVSIPKEIYLGQPEVVRLRLQNGSNETWKFQRGSLNGVHVRGWIEPEGNRPPPWADQNIDPPNRIRLSGGMMNVDVPPQGTIEIDVPVPAIKKAGRYELFLDIWDEQLRSFGETVGSKPFKKIVEIQRAPIAQR